MRKSDIHRYYSPLFHLFAAFVFRITILCVMIYNALIYRIRFCGRHHLRSTGKGAFLISNHTLYLDPAIIAHAILPQRTCFTAMEKTFAMPFVGSYIRFLGAFPLSGRIPFHNLISIISKAFRKKWLIHFFPEGELAGLNTTVAEFKEGVFFLAFRFNVPVIPVVIIPEPRLSLEKKMNQFFCRVKVKILEPVHPSRFRREGKSFRERVRLMADYCRDIMCAEMQTGKGFRTDRPGDLN